MNETNEMWRDYHAQVVKPKKAQWKAQAERDATLCGLAVQHLTDVHWRCTTPTGAVFDYWPTTRNAKIAGAFVYGLGILKAARCAEGKAS